MGKPFWLIAVLVVLTTACNENLPSVSGLSENRSGEVKATVDQLESCRNRVGVELQNVPYSDITVYATQPDNRNNAVIRWQARNGASGFCRVNSSNTVTEFVKETEGGANPSPSPRPNPFNPQSLVGLERNLAIARAEENGFYVVDERNTNVVYMSDGVQLIALNIGQPNNTVNSISYGITPSPGSSPPPQEVRATVAQLESCRNRVRSELQVASSADIVVYPSLPDANGNAVIRWETRSGANGFCRVNSSNTIVGFVTTSLGPNTQPSPSPTPSPRPSPSPSPVPSPSPSGEPVTGWW